MFFLEMYVGRGLINEVCASYLNSKIDQEMEIESVCSRLALPSSNLFKGIYVYLFLDIIFFSMKQLFMGKHLQRNYQTVHKQYDGLFA